jgi:two-component system, LuxR family, sensor kinase FixL
MQAPRTTSVSAGYALAALFVAASLAYVFLPPDGWAVGSVGDTVLLAFFIAIGIGIAWVNHLLRVSEAAHRQHAELAGARAQRLDAIINTTVDAIILINSKGAIEAFNHGAERLFGYPESEALGRNVSMLMPSPYHEEHDQYLQRYLTTGHAQIIGIGRAVTGRRRDGTTFPAWLSVGEMSIGGEKKFTGVLHDLTQRAQLQEELRASEARWAAIVESAVDSIIVIDALGRIEAFNPAAERLFGYTIAEVAGRNVDMLMPSPYHEEHDGYLARYLATGEAKIIGIGREVSGRHKDGTIFPLHLSVGQLTIGGQRKFTGILHDLRSRVAMEEQLREQTSLARLGEMAAVIAHEVKNPLAGIRGAIQVIGGRLTHAPDAAVANEIVARIDSLDQLMKELLLFARPPQPRRASIEIAPLVSGTARFLSRDPSVSNVEIVVEGSSPPVLADAEMLQIVFQNLLINGAHAMSGVGTLRVAVSTRDNACQVAFTDAGPGIPVTSETRSSCRSSRRNRAAPAWVCQRRNASSRRMAGKSPSTARQLAGRRSGS